MTPQRYERVADLLSGDDLRVGPVREATAHLVEAPAMWEAALKALSDDPFHLVERRST